MYNIPEWAYWISIIVVNWIVLKSIFAARIISEKLSEKVGNKIPYWLIFALLPILVAAEFWLYYTILVELGYKDAKVIFSVSFILFIIVSFWIMFKEGEFSYWDYETKDGSRDKRRKNNELNVVPRSARSKYLCNFYKCIVVLWLIAVVVYISDKGI